MQVNCKIRQVQYDVIHCYMWCNKKCAEYEQAVHAHPQALHAQIMVFLEKHSSLYELIYSLKKIKTERKTGMEKKFLCQVKNELRVLTESELLELCKTEFSSITMIQEIGSEYEVVFKLAKKSTEKVEESKPEKKPDKKKDAE
ncbi:MAG: hypothetical protein KBA26_06035 [Candidatus Delongbacteria bacterium]|nr:hypothetical protein [Candidatus Delongbacteria bacterium]